MSVPTNPQHIPDASLEGARAVGDRLRAERRRDAELLLEDLEETEKAFEPFFVEQSSGQDN
jgi:hypothetical protein